MNTLINYFFLHSKHYILIYFINSQEWASCLEANTEKLSEFVLTNLRENSEQIDVEQNNLCITIKLNGNLKSLPYEWYFLLEILPKSLVSIQNLLEASESKCINC